MRGISKSEESRPCKAIDVRAEAIVDRRIKGRPSATVENTTGMLAAKRANCYLLDTFSRKQEVRP